MFKLNLKIAFRNLLKNKIYAAINITGLALGLTAFVLLLLYINNEKSYDRWSPELNNVYKVREKHPLFTPDNKEHWQNINESRLADLLRAEVSQVKYATKVDEEWGEGFSIKIKDQDPVIIKGVRDADSSFFKVFPYEFLYGDKNKALSAPNSIVLKQKTAEQLFGTDQVIGNTLKVVMWNNDEGAIFTVTGVVKEVNTPESVGFTAIIRTGEKDEDPNYLNASNYCLVFVSLEAGADLTVVNKNVQKAYLDLKAKFFEARGEKISEYIKKGNDPRAALIPIADMHASPPFTLNWLQKLKPVIAIAAFLFLISIINFINLATAQSVQRAKEIGVRKVLGSYKNQLLFQFLFEAALQCILALFVSIILVEITLPTFNSQFHVALTFWQNPALPSLIVQLLGVFVLVTILAGFYPAWIIANFNPVTVLKGKYEGSFKGLMLRNVLVVFQFVISVTFIISIGIMYMQSQYMSKKDLGFDRSKLINIATSYDESFATRVRKIPGVQYVATTTQVLGNTFNVPIEIAYEGKNFEINTVTLTMDAFPALGVKLLEGRLFSSEYKQDTVNAVVINEAASKVLGGNLIGKTYDMKGYKQNFTFQIVGVIKNYHNEGFDKEVIPTVYKVSNLGGTSATNNLLIRFDTDQLSSAIAAVEKEWKSIYPDFPMIFQFVDDAFKKSLLENERFLNMIILFSIISISLSLFGLLALSNFVAKRRTKEIAVRKVLGASNMQIISLLNRNFLLLVLIANIISWPVAYLITQKWLESFAYRIEMPISPFFAATLASLFIAFITVSIQAQKSATISPVKSLKYE